MADYVVDASVVMDFLITGPSTAHAIAFFNAAQDTDQLYITSFCRLECVNVLWKHVRFHGLEEDQARQLIADLTSMPFQELPIIALYEAAFDIGLSQELAIYDSIYVALAEQLSVPLVTADNKQAQKAEAHGVTVQFLDTFTAATP